MAEQICIFCGGNPAEKDHRNRCDGRQGRLGGFEVRLAADPIAAVIEALTEPDQVSYFRAPSAADRPPIPDRMMEPNEPDPDDPYRPYQAHSITSAAAASSIEITTAITLREKVYRAIREGGPHGATDDELQIGLGMEGSTERPRRVELTQAGRIIDSGQRRETRSGRRAVVWVIVNA